MLRNADRIKQLIVCGIVFAMVAVSWADGFRNPPEGAAGLGRGASRLTTGDDASTISHNPANMLDLSAPTVTPTFTFGYAKKEYTSPMGGSEDMEAVVVMPAIYAAVPVGDGRCAFGVGVNSPFGQANEWEEKGLFTGVTPYFSEIQTINVSPAVATKLVERLWVGLGVNIMWANFELRQTNPWSGIPGDNVGPSSHISLEGDGVGLGARVGLTWLPTDRQRIAVAYHSPISVSCEGSMNVGPLPPGLPPFITPESYFETELEFPQIVALGYGCQVLDSVRVEANVEWIEHSRYDKTVINAANNNLLLQQMASMDPLVAVQDWDDTWTFSFGADWAVAEHWTLRGGYVYLPSPVPDATVAPASAEADQQLITMGVGYSNDRHRIDLTYAPAIVDDRTDAMGGSYEFDAHLFAATYSAAF